MGEKKLEDLGLSTTVALQRLQNEIEQTLNQIYVSQKSRKSKSWLRDALHHRNQHTTLNWVSIILVVLVIVFLIIAYILKAEDVLLYQALFIAILLLTCITVELIDNRHRNDEIPRRIKKLVTKIKSNINISWTSENYPHLLSPFSPCITLQWTYRDNKLVNLPWALLVKDDIILIRPGQITPGYCEAIDKNAEHPLLHAKEVYGPTLQSANECFSVPKSRKPLENRKYRLLETPYLNNLKMALEQPLEKSVTVQNKQRYFVKITVLEQILLPTVLILIIIINAGKYIYYDAFMGTINCSELFILTPLGAILPLISLIFPLIWNCLNYFGMIRLKCVFDTNLQLQQNKDSYEEYDNNSVDMYKYNCNYKMLWSNFLDILKGNESMMMQSANTLHVLGSLTALCCIDKKGILSWPNPTAEKVFFLHNKNNVSQSSSLTNLGDLNMDGDSLRGGLIGQIHNDSGAVQEVLDVTHTQNDPFKLHFDDTGWQKHLNSLKPLGLAILLNTCNYDTQETYTKFCSHITCEAMYNENLIPVTNRRCLCELAKQMGFSDQAQKIFTLERQLSSFRHLQTETARRDNKYARSLHLSTKLKFPFPHMFAVVVKELSSGSMQLLSQGTADIILDSCIDYWDGHDLFPLTHSDRKKIQDFYQRSSLTAYCTAFAYRPIHKGVSDKLSHIYLELPSDSRHLYVSRHSPTPVHSDCRAVLEPRIKTSAGQFYSTDSLLYNDSPYSNVSDVEGCFEMQHNQIFIGMVTMQYQVQSDMVTLIEQLEEACIRFVHFSKENELRSRVFSEKMGLESGWNCHISLLSERSSTLDSSKVLSYSAPSAINLEYSIVKFDTEPELQPDEPYNMNDHNTSQESVPLQDTVFETNGTSHEWQSLSCLTDSTEQSAPINFDMSNRAKLPRGIDKIRPHIENIDNVPLLVSLFTDCTASSTKEMIRIMQDYGEIICVMGSSANYENMGIFIQADASIAIEPLYPQVCQKVQMAQLVENGTLSPIDLSRCLNSVACSLSIKREDPLSITVLIVEARHYMKSMWNVVQFWSCSCTSVSLIQLISTSLMLPAVFTTGQILWICCIIIPILSTSLMSVKVDPEIMQVPQAKQQIEFNWEVFVFVLWCYGAKFASTILITIMIFAGALFNFCMDTCTLQTCTCKYFYIPTIHLNSTTSSDWIIYSSNILTAQNFCVIAILLQLMAVSTSFIHRDHLIWNKSPHSNLLWLATLILISVLQTIFTVLNIKQIYIHFDNYMGFEITNSILIFAVISPLFTIGINELIKREEIKVNLRYRRRARLDFGTKLGMNSPF